MKMLFSRGLGKTHRPPGERRWHSHVGRVEALIRLATALTLAGSAALWAAESSRGNIKAGFAERDITPEIGMREAHAVARHVFTAFRDRCKVRASVFDDGRHKVALIGLDALMVPRAVVMEARAGIEKACGIPGRAVMIAASHSHSSGPVGIVMPGQFDGAPADIQQLAYEESSLADPNYLRVVVREIIEASRLADANRQSATVGFGFGHEDTVVFNRRQRMKNGQSWSHAGAMNPDIVSYAGPIDPQVGVLGAWDSGGQMLGVMLNFACHATTNPGAISANWPGASEKLIQGALQTRAPMVFLAGACGDVTQVPNLDPYERPDQESWLRLVGGRVGAEAVKVLLGMPRGAELAVDSRQRTWKIKRRVPAPERVASARAILGRGKPARATPNWTFARETVLVDYLVSIEPEAEVEVQAIQVGAAVFISSPGEYFVQYGLDIKAGSPFLFTFPVELANGCVGYVPTEEAFGPNGGGYETRLTLYSNLEVTAGRQFAETGIALAKEMTPSPAPKPPRLSAPGQPWTYGNVGPELR